jgi:hypothetical protein
MTPDEYKNGRGSFWVQFTFGAILGVFLGIYLCREYASSFALVALLFLGSVVSCAVVAGLWGDKFWEGLLRIFGWTGRR